MAQGRQRAGAVPAEPEIPPLTRQRADRVPTCRSAHRLGRGQQEFRENVRSTAKIRTRTTKPKVDATGRLRLGRQIRSGALKGRQVACQRISRVCGRFRPSIDISIPATSGYITAAVTVFEADSNPQRVHCGWTASRSCLMAMVETTGTYQAGPHVNFSIQP